ncbi:24-methylenesterol C-methyltransferase 2 [Denticeps clupeoides]|uniref:Methyltransferase type 11 domain-containing protein n=1 Tax=Denticeps clupeoides TaxID=299321 RepID=A0AAY4CLE4_9TELE|nr:24-methylenesterol C-methyltransferase 2-like [Denticeps clupeoides]XP_028849637.1 24-methylenesterol C-methyltransferase 2-like [Denticeps clupeoides]XP_028849638.1 24-methylenesterol C-methyltransferase 2-like [Denticeps clupeoides]
MLAKKIGEQLQRPTKSIGGWLADKFFKWHNTVLEENAVKLSAISPDQTVLELGHGPGLGLEVAASLLPGPRGKLLGVDYSEYMHQLASKRLQPFITRGKVTLYLCDLAAMPIEDSSVDKVYHCNCYYFWPDLRAAATEIHRVMKPGALMVTTLRLKSVALVASKNMLPTENWQPDIYIEALKATGFTNVRMEDRTDKNITFQAIFATASK